LMYTDPWGFLAKIFLGGSLGVFGQILFRGYLRVFWPNSF
jgi:hypothetical protein